MAIQSINPATGKLLRSFEPLTDEAARAEDRPRRRRLPRLRDVPLEHRALWMRKLAAMLEHETDDLATLITQEMGKPLDAARARGPQVRRRLPLLRRKRRAHPRPRAHPDREPTTATCAGTRSASCSPSCPGTSPSGRSSASSRPR